jgi:hypothetical protein
MHHGFGGKLEEAMRREFYNRLGGNIPTSDEMLEWTVSDDSPPKSVSAEGLHKNKITEFLEIAFNGLEKLN